MMRMELKACLICMLIAASLVAAFPAPSIAADEPVPVANGTRTSASQSAVAVKFVKENESEVFAVDKNKIKARECTLEAINIIVSKSDDAISQECMEVLRVLITNAGKTKTHQRFDDSDDLDLRKELKDLAKKEERYERMNDEINQAEELLGERNSGKGQEEESQTEDLGVPYRYLDKKAKFEKAGSVKSYQIPGPEREGRENLPRNNYPRGDGAEIGIPNEQESEDDVLVIPLRFLRKQLLIDLESPREKELSAIPSPARKEVNSQRQDTDAAKWLLHAILNAGVDEKESSARPPQYDVVDAGKEKSDKTLKEAKSLKVDHENSKVLKRKPSQVRELKKDVLSRVEDDIAKLGEDLQQLQLTSKQ